MSVVFTMMRVGRRHDHLHFSHGDHGKEAAEQQEHREEQAEGPQHRPDVDFLFLTFPPQSLSETVYELASSDCQSYLHTTFSLPTKYLATFFILFQDLLGLAISVLCCLIGNSNPGNLNSKV